MKPIIWTEEDPTTCDRCKAKIIDSFWYVPGETEFVETTPSKPDVLIHHKEILCDICAENIKTEMYFLTKTKNGYEYEGKTVQRGKKTRRKKKTSA